MLFCVGMILRNEHSTLYAEVQTESYWKESRQFESTQGATPFVDSIINKSKNNKKCMCKVVS